MGLSDCLAVRVADDDTQVPQLNEQLGVIVRFLSESFPLWLPDYSIDSEYLQKSPLSY